MNWKIKKDSYYSSLCEKFGEDFIKRAGFFYDSYKDEKDFKKTANILCTHIPDIIDDNSVILLATGAFCPFHSGHLEMMTNAKKKIETMGKKVVAGYISPSHDEYVLNKIPEGYNINKRIKIIQEKIKEHDWLFVDPWEGIFVKYAINFTDVIDRLEEYVFFHTGKKIPIYFVCGSDNARFSLTFLEKGNCIVVKRPGYNEEEYKSIISTDRIVWADGYNEESSTNIRKQGINKQKHIYAYIRKENFHPFENKLIKLFRKNFNHIDVVDIKYQLEIFKKIKPKNDDNKYIPIVSLDRLINGDVNYKLSRIYNMFGTKKLGYYDRGFDCNFDFKNCYLFDDDIYTGGTIKYASDALEKKKIKVDSVFTFKMGDGIEILDCRDFLISHPEGGLFVKLPNGKISRVPYIYPFVCPNMRASIKNPIDFSIEVWKLNFKYFSKNKKLRVDNIPSIKEALLCSGFSEEDKMYNICKYFIKLLEEVKQ